MHCLPAVWVVLLGWVLCMCLLGSQVEPEAYAAWCHLCVGGLHAIIEAAWLPGDQHLTHHLSP